MVNACLVDFYSANEYKSLGCYKYKPNMGMTVLEGEDPDVLDGDYKLRTNAIEKCELVAMKKRYGVFAIHDGGACLVSRIQDPKFNKYGISQDCKSDGKGASGASHVYLTSGTEGMLRKNFEYMCTTIPEFFFFPSKETNYNELPVYVKYGNNVKDLPVTV